MYVRIIMLLSFDPLIHYADELHDDVAIPEVKGTQCVQI